MQGVAEKKQQLRKTLLEKRNAVQGIGEKSSQIIRNLKSTRIYQDAAAILCYVSKADEVETHTLLLDALSQGKQVFVPYCPPGGAPMVFYEIHGLTDLIPGSFGVLEPDPGLCRPYREGAALCIVPAIAFDKKGFRLGYGKGYYDKFLSANLVSTAGLCFSELLFDSLPVTVLDVAVEQVVTQDRILILE